MNALKLLLILAISCLLSCVKSSQDLYRQPLTPIQLEPDSTWVVLSDYVAEPHSIKSIRCPDGYLCDWDKIGHQLLILTPEKGDWLETIRLNTTNGILDVLIKRSPKIKVTFSFRGDKPYQRVHITGEMNAWNDLATPLVSKDGIWTTEMWLAPSKYPYLLVLDGQRSVDYQNKDMESNGMGGFNSILKVDGPDPERVPFLQSSEIRRGGFTVLAENQPRKILVFWQDSLVQEIVPTGQEVSIDIPKVAKKFRRSFMRIFAENDQGVANDLWIPLHQGEVMRSPQQFERTDFHAQTMYFLMVDRFCDGNPKNNMPTDDPEIHPKANFHGGDLAGIILKLKEGYFQNLGINTLWLSPIPANPLGSYGLWDKGGVRSTFSAYHGYWPVGLNRIDARFGTSEELKELVRLAHSQGINVLLDLVAHHVHEEHPLYLEKRHQGWFTDLHLPDGSLNTERWDDHRLTTWFDVFLPTFNFAKQEVCDMLSDSAVYWLESYAVDGFRHDATKHIELRFWRTLTNKIRSLQLREKRLIFQIGETYGSPELISSYISSGMLDAQFDFNVYDAAVEAFCKDSIGFDHLKYRINQSLQIYGHHHLMGNMSGNQDKNRFMALASGEILFEEDGKLAGWTRDIQYRPAHAFRKLSMMHAFNHAIPGVPCTYYGDDIGLTGGNDPDNRRMMKFESLEKEERRLLEELSTLGKLRRQLPALSYGSFRFKESDSRLLFMERRFFDQVVWILINKSTEHVNFTDVPEGLKQVGIYSSEKKLLGAAEVKQVAPLSWTIIVFEK